MGHPERPRPQQSQSWEEGDAAARPQWGEHPRARGPELEKGAGTKACGVREGLVPHSCAPAPAAALGLAALG